MTTKYMSGFYNAPKSEAQKKFIGGRLRFKSGEEDVKKLCAEIEALGKLYRAVGEKYIRIDILRNENHEQEGKPEFSFMRDEYSPDGSLKERIQAYEAQGDQDTAPEAQGDQDTAPPASFDEDELDF